MAIVNLQLRNGPLQSNLPLNLYSQPVWFGDSIVSKPALMTLMGDNGFGADYKGTFAYNSLGQPEGSVTEYTFFEVAAQIGGTFFPNPVYTITAINGKKGLSAEKLFAFSATGNTTDALKYLLVKDDVINGSRFDVPGIDEILYGWAGNDTIFGIAGDDIIGGGTGRDRLVGGNGQDFFFFDLANSRHADVIEDFGFSGLRDKIVLQQSAFNCLTAGELAETQFVIGKAALDADDRIILNGNRIFYDADGNGVGKAILVSTVKYATVGLVGVPPLTAEDFLIVNSINEISVV